MCDKYRDNLASPLNGKVQDRRYVHNMDGRTFNTPYELIGIPYSGRGSHPAKFLPPPGFFSNPPENSCPPRPKTKKNIALAYLKAA
jgi:hypothetical protein